MTRKIWMAGAAATALALAWHDPSFAAPARRVTAAAPPTTEQRLRAMQQQLQSQADLIAAQARALAAHDQTLADQAAEIDALRRERIVAAEEKLLNTPAPQAPPPRVRAAAVTPTNPNPLAPVAGPAGPVGEPPTPAKVQVAALPDQQSVLTAKGGWYLEPSFTYTRSSANVLVFRGVEIVTGVQIGLLQANNAARDTLVGTLDVRHGVTNRLEVGLRAPYVYRADRIQTVAQRDQTITQNQSLTGRHIGDLELSARYQINRARAGRPIFVAGMRYKSDTGIGPFDIAYDEFGVATGLATGSGFHAVEPSISVLVPTDPAVIFASLGYIHNFSRVIDKDIGGARVGRVSPGDAISISTGFGFALNPRFSFSLGYKHSYLYPTFTTLNDTRQRSNALQVGSFMFGWSFALTPRISLASSLEIGATSDAPDLNLSIRLPIRF